MSICQRTHLRQSRYISTPIGAIDVLIIKNNKDMMTNLQSSAFVAKTTQLLSSVARLRLLLVMFLTLCVSANVWGAEVTFTTTLSGGFSNNSKTANGVTVTFNGSPSWQSGHVRVYSKATISFSSTNNNITKIVMTATSTDYAKTWSADVGSTAVNNTTITWTGSAKSITLTNTASAQSRLSKIVVTTADTHTVTWTINPAAGGSLSSTSGSSITVTPDAAYTYASPAYEVTSGSATVSQSGNTFTATPTEDCTIQINMVEKPKYTVNWYVNGTKEHSQTGVAGTALTDIPNLEDYECEDKVFVGWTTESSYEHATNAPTGMITSTTGMTIPENGEDYYAVFAKETTTTGGTTTTTFTAGTDNIATGKNGIKFTMSNTTGSGGYYQVYSGSAMTINSDNPITSFTITCTASGTDKYGPGNITFKTGSYSYSGTNGTWTGESKTIESNNSSAQLRITKIVVTTSGGTTTTYSDYITTCSTEKLVSVLPKIMNFWQSIFGVSLGYLRDKIRYRHVLGGIVTSQMHKYRFSSYQYVKDRFRRIVPFRVANNRAFFCEQGSN